MSKVPHVGGNCLQGGQSGGHDSTNVLMGGPRSFKPKRHVVEIEQKPVGLSEQVVAEIAYTTLAAEPSQLLDGHFRWAQGQRTAYDGHA